MDLSPGYRIRRKLVLVRQVGEGGMSTVWLADDVARRRRVAVKILSADLAKNTEVVARFVAEAAAISRIDSPNVPKVYERGTLHDGTPFLVMELMEGVDLDTYLRKNGTLTLEATARLVMQIGAALEAAHELGIVHRDVKAENIFIQGDGETMMAKLFDFGIAKIPFDGSRTHTGTLMGTPAYMSVEQLLSAKDVDHRTDLWSLGVVAYLCLTGRLPFAGETFGAVCVSIHQGLYTPPSHLGEGIPTAIDAWLAQALSPKLDARFQSAREMGDRLAALVRGSSQISRPPKLKLVVDDDASDEPRSLVAVSRTRRVLKEPRKDVFAAMVAMCAAFAVYWMPSAARAGSWLPDGAAGAWTHLSTAARAAVVPTRPLEPSHFVWRGDAGEQEATHFVAVRATKVPATVLEADAAESLAQVSHARPRRHAPPYYSDGWGMVRSAPTPWSVNDPASSDAPEAPTDDVEDDADQRFSPWVPSQPWVPPQLPVGFGDRRD